MTCLSSTSVKAPVSANKSVNAVSSILSKAALVGAKTVKVAVSSLRVVTKSAAVSAATSVEKFSSASAISTIVWVESVPAGGGRMTWSTTCITPLSAITSTKETADLLM